jgi:biopolymer transport protein ExbB/TolQ
MSIIAIGMNLMLAGLLIAALMMGYRLNVRLKALRDSHDGFARAVADLDAAAARAEQGLADLRAATDEAHDALADRIEKARALTAKLDRHIQAAPQATSREARELETSVERVTHKLGSILSAAREPRPERATRLAALAIQPSRPRFEDDLFEEPVEPQPLRAGARR